MGDWQTPVAEATNRLISSFKGDGGQLLDFQSLSFAIEDFETEISISTPTVGEEDEIHIPGILIEMIYHAESAIRVLGLQTARKLLSKGFTIDYNMKLSIFLMRAIDGGGTPLEQVEGLQHILALVELQDQNGIIQFLMPSIARVAQTSTITRVKLKALEVLRAIAEVFPEAYTSVKLIQPLIRSAIGIEFKTINSLGDMQKEVLSMASAQSLTILLSNSYARQNLGWDIPSILDVLIAPFTNAAISDLTDNRMLQEEMLHILPSHVEGILRLSKSWSGIFILTSWARNSPSIVHILVKAFENTKSSSVQCIMIILFSCMLDLKIDQDAIERWIENTGTNLNLSGAHYSSSGILESSRCVRFSYSNSVSDIFTRTRRAILLHSMLNSGLHTHLVFACRPSEKPMKFIKNFLNHIIELCYLSLTPKEMLYIQDITSIENSEGVKAKELSDIASLGLQKQPSDARESFHIFVGLNSSEKRPLQTLKGDITLEEPEFEEMILEDIVKSQILNYSSVNWIKWDWMCIESFLETSRDYSAQGVRICIKNKAFKRLFAFFAKRLANIPKDNHIGSIAIKCGIVAIELLLSNMEGRNFLIGKSNFMEHLPEILLIDVFRTAIAIESGATDNDMKERILHPLHLQSTHASGIVELILSMTNNREGMHLLHRCGIPDILDRFVIQTKNLELCRIVFMNLNLGISDFPQALVQTAFQKGQPFRHLAFLSMRKNLHVLNFKSSDNKMDKVMGWFSKVLIECLYRNKSEEMTHICSLLLRLVQIGCAKHIINSVDKSLLQSNFPCLANILLSCESGISFINDKSWIQSQVKEQLSIEKCEEFRYYVDNLFTIKSSLWLCNSNSSLDSYEGYLHKIFLTEFNSVCVDLSLYNIFSSLGSTRQGLEILKELGVISNLVEKIKDIDELSWSRQVYLWYLALICLSSDAASQHVVNCDGLDTMIFISENSPDLSLKGTAVVALNIACQNRIIDKYIEEISPNWVVYNVGKTSNDIKAKLSMPHSPSKILELYSRHTMSITRRWCTKIKQKKLPKRKPLSIQGQLDTEVAIGKLGNPITEEEGKLELAQIREKSPEKLSLKKIFPVLYHQLDTLDISSTGRQFLWNTTHHN